MTHAQQTQRRPNYRMQPAVSRRQAAAFLTTPKSVQKLFDTLGPRFKARPGGYTRIIHTSNRIGDNAPMSILELVEKSEKTEPEKKPAAEKKAEEKKTAAASGDQGAGEKKPPKQKKAKKESSEKKD